VEKSNFQASHLEFRPFNFRHVYLKYKKRIMWKTWLSS